MYSKNMFICYLFVKLYAYNMIFNKQSLEELVCRVDDAQTNTSTIQN